MNLLRVLDGRPRPLGEVAVQLRPSLPVADDAEALLVLNGLCGLIAAARRREENGKGTRPFLRVGLHLWVRELRRMVCSVRPVEAPDGDTGLQAQYCWAGWVRAGSEITRAVRSR